MENVQQTLDEDGFVVLRTVLPASDVDRIADDWSHPSSAMSEYLTKREGRFLLGKPPEFIGSIYQHEFLANLGTSLFGPNLALYMNRILIKDQCSQAKVKMHQDMPYYNGFTSKVILFLALQPIREVDQSGGMTFLKGSHKYGYIGRGELVRQPNEDFEDVTPDLNLGDLVLMSPYTWHYSRENVSGLMRPILQLVYQSADDGSYAGEEFGVPSPTLIKGQWCTKLFRSLGSGLLPD